MKVTREEVQRVAELANLELTSTEEASMLRDLNAMLNYVAELNELDTTSVAPMAQVSEALTSEASPNKTDKSTDHSTEHGAGLREDIVAASLDRSVVLACAPETDGVFFKVPRVIER